MSQNKQSSDAGFRVVCQDCEFESDARNNAIASAMVVGHEALEGHNVDQNAAEEVGA